MSSSIPADHFLLLSQMSPNQNPVAEGLVKIQPPYSNDSSNLTLLEIFIGDISVIHLIGVKAILKNKTKQQQQQQQQQN